MHLKKQTNHVIICIYFNQTHHTYRGSKPLFKHDKDKSFIFKQKTTKENVSYQLTIPDKLLAQRHV